MAELGAILTLLDLAAAVAFAATGALAASRKQLDILGFAWLAVATGVGGGTVRDLLLGLDVFWVVAPAPLVACLLTAAVMHFVAPMMESRYRYILVFDAVGMALVTVAGAARAVDAGAGALVAVVMGVFTASVGGIIRDTLAQEPSVILRREIYVAAAALGAAVFVVLDGIMEGRAWAAVLAFAAAFGLRAAALAFGWTLPVWRARPGRDVGRR
ncbi:trimeric intracellular cation channel family protein [Roseitranquillus sediminis]|uniref:trimeric intracellular cation channel family protein n=1 Tax=Roseitranquillus sediminis TaxID=2809051 RepID=UPI001D0CB728|nr:TRIC cation channel family protein [Roseitranquillus sediminis]MBM9593616.1 TRIC cation channel family protein [Roseitranquillus sediminis]